MTDFRRARIDLDAVTANIAHIVDVVAPARVLCVVKANAYSHGSVQVAEAALAGGAQVLGVADLTEAVELRQAGITAPILAWIHGPGEDFQRARDFDIEVAVSTLDQLQAAAAARLPEIQIKLDTGLSRNGAPKSVWTELFAEAVKVTAQGTRVHGLMSHLSGTSEADDRQQVSEFREAIALAEDAGLDIDVQHIAATGAALRMPEARFTQVRIGLGTYGLSPFDDATSADLGLHPVMQLEADVINVKRVPEGASLSYGYLYTTPKATTLALVPLGYVDGIPRIATAAPVVINGHEYAISGRVAMDQFIVDVGDAEVSVGDTAVVFGDPAQGAPRAEALAASAQTINYEVVARIGNRVARVYEHHGSVDA